MTKIFLSAKIASRALPLIATLVAPVAQPQTNWTTFGGDIQRTGFNPAETVLNPTNVGSLQLHWSFDLHGPSLTQPTLLAGVVMPDGQHRDLVYVATLFGQFYALDSATGEQIWEVDLPSVQTTCSDFDASNKLVGVIATPTIDQANQRIFVVAGDGTLHALNVATGSELPGWPLQILDPDNAAPRTFVYGSPTLDSNQLYIATASACDIPPYHGQVITVNVDPSLDTPQVVTRWFPTSASGPGGGGIWGPGGVSLEPDGMNLYAATGNALTIPENPPYADSIVKLSPQSGGNALAPVAADNPSLPEALIGADVDFGATPLLYQAPGCPAQLAVMNKSGILFIYDRDKIAEGSRQQIDISTDAGDFIGIPAYDPIHQQLYLGNPHDSQDGPYKHGIIALSVENCSVNPVPAWQQQVGDTTEPENPVIPPTVANGVVYYVSGLESVLYAFDAVSGTLLWDSSTQSITQGIYAAPTMVNGQVFVVAYDHKMYAFGLPPD